MNIRCVIFSSVVTCVIGSILDVALAEVHQSDRRHPRTHRYYAWAGAVLGLIVGAGQEAIGQQSHRNDD